MPKILANTLLAKDKDGQWVQIPVVVKDGVQPTSAQIQAAVNEWFAEHPEFIVQTDKTLTVEDAHADSEAVGIAIQNLRDEIAYTPISISSFSISSVTFAGGGTSSSGTIEKGKEVTGFVASYNINKTPAVLTFAGASLTPAKSGTISKSGNYTSTTSFALTATDSGAPNISPTTSTKSVSLSFYDRIYWGSDEIPGSVNSAFLLGLSNSTLSNSKGRTLNNVNVANGEYLWYALPASMGTCTFTYNGFTGGFTEVTTFNHTNASGHTASYRVYRSDNPSLGMIDGLIIT